MAALTKTPETEVSQNLRIAQILTVLIVVLGAVATAGGLFIPGLYRDTEWIIPQNRGQDLVTLVVALPGLLLALPGVSRGSGRATLVWIGLLGYMYYTYTGASMAFNFNKFFLIYVALFSLSIFALVTAATGINSADLKRQFDEGTPYRSVIAFLIVMGLMLTALWLGQVIPFLTSDKLPELIVKGDTPTNFVYVLDLGIVVPVSFLSALLLRNRQVWGYILGGFVMIKAATMGLALLSMSLFASLAGQMTDEGRFLTIIWVVLAVSALSMSFWFFRHCRK